ncbi:MAG: TonB-dependent receptor plug domain-containing protein [Gemmatimonadota bacterium]
MDAKPKVRGIATLMAVALMAGCASGGQAGPYQGLEPGEDSTGSGGEVRADDGRFVETVQEMLQGRVSGVQVIDHPVCGHTIRIRGMSDSLLDVGGAGECEREPLLIIDQKPVALGNLVAALDGLAPTDIKRIRVLKDVASTSVYGTRGAYGVILISTNR